MTHRRPPSIRLDMSRPGRATARARFGRPYPNARRRERHRWPKARFTGSRPDAVQSGQQPASREGRVGMSDAPPPPSWPPPSAPPPSEPTDPAMAAQPPATAPPAPTGSIPPAQTPGPAVASERPRNGMIIAVLVLGVASLVAVISFVLFPLGLIAGIVGVVLGIVALTRSKSRASNRRPAIAGLICSAIAVIIAMNF